MKKIEVYSWRISPELKTALEDAARVENERGLTLALQYWLRPSMVPDIFDSVDHKIDKSPPRCRALRSLQRLLCDGAGNRNNCRRYANRAAFSFGS